MSVVDIWKKQLGMECQGEQDGVWLRRFVQHHDGEAFAKIVQRHAAMVHAVCRRLLGNRADAEDASQATFLILAKRAYTIRQTGDVGAWLFGVARKVAIQVVRERNRRARREHQVQNRLTEYSPEVLEAQETARLCDEELARLPWRYRQVLLLNCIEGLPKVLIAQRLGWPEGTVASCITRGKKLLAQRLIRRGVAPALATSVLSSSIAQAIPTSLQQLSNSVAACTAGQSLQQTALPGAWQLFQKVESVMLLKRSLLAMICTVGLAAAIPGIVWGLHAWRIPAQITSETMELIVQDKPAPTKDAAIARQVTMTDKESLQGRWMLVAVVSNKDDGFDPFAGKIIGSMLEFQGDQLQGFNADGSKVVTPKEVQHLYRLNDKVQPKELDVVMMAEKNVTVVPGLYSLQCDTLIICTSNPVNTRPIEIGAARNGSTKLAIYRRVVPLGTLGEEQRRITEEAAFAQTNKSLRECLIAMHNYHKDYNRLPAAAIFDKQTGKPLLSWRVLLLPYLEHDALYREFKLDEPWDSEHNKKLISRMPKVFAHPVNKSHSEFKTHYRVFVAPAAPPAGSSQEFAPSFSLSPQFKLTLGVLAVSDGTSNTIAITEAEEPIIWTKPEELELADDGAKIPKMGAMPGSPFFIAVHWDGAGHLYRKEGERMSREGYEKLLRQQIGWSDAMNFDVSGIMVR